MTATMTNTTASLSGFGEICHASQRLADSSAWKFVDSSGCKYKWHKSKIGSRWTLTDKSGNETIAAFSLPKSYSQIQGILDILKPVDEVFKLLVLVTLKMSMISDLHGNTHPQNAWAATGPCHRCAARHNHHGSLAVMCAGGSQSLGGAASSGM
ncbi:hypothetical protein DL89DRAFT_286681 [Linderina pennispora]|uniref:Uncharacterized protein n=1 Tax=Linderina pennispora TaxID=61395 RepID=A0A1Y1VXG0_9FUNG|nr:uncharacterized protein DL89DRAFT_286681 [Linderina pennispora]ORX65970.1 hypothetical protein DL89DRAFT_286681 [Linderina pennispora]